MGELSKSIGEDGEALVQNFLTIIGWKKALESTSVKCSRPSQHAAKEKERSTHGIDLLYPQKKQLDDFCAEYNVISVKFSRAPYLKNPTSKFKEYIEDLAHAIECFKLSDQRRVIAKEFFVDAPFNRECFSGILFWLTSDKMTDQSVIPKVATVQIKADLKFSTIQVVDNDRASFIYNSINTARKIYSEDKIYFNYARFSENFLDRTIPTFGDTMPSEYFSSPILPLRVNNEKGDNVAFVISCDEEFSKDNLQELISLATDITSGLSSNLTFFFRQYNESSDVSEVRSAILNAREQLGSTEVRVYSLQSDFRSLLNGQ